MNAIVQQIERESLPEDRGLNFRVGDTVRVAVKVREGDKVRIQNFEGVVIRIRKGLNRTTFTVRKVSYGVGVERIFPLYSPNIESITVKSRARVRRAKLYYLRKRFGRAAKLKEIRFR